jgi:phenylalanyl-tRNA synthetase alpha chain
MPAITNLAASMDSMQQLLIDASTEIGDAISIEQLDAIDATLLGRGSPISEARRGLGAIKDPDERRDTGRAINDVVNEIKDLVSSRRTTLAATEEAAALGADSVDVTLPGRMPPRGTHHLITQTINEIVDIFVSLGYTMATGPEAETEFYNFTAMNIPRTHPSRLESDTLYLDYGDEEGEVLLRTHTSPMQARYMEQHDPPVYVVVPGKVFRADATDATHSPVFHQIEGLAVDENITFADLKGTLAAFAKEFFGRDTKVKFIPHYFPFTEPSAEMHAYSNGRWIELLGCGMVNPAVFEHVGYDPEKVTGFAFGMGPERLAIIRHGITDAQGNNDLRPLLDPDHRILGQYL